MINRRHMLAALSALGLAGTTRAVQADTISVHNGASNTVSVNSGNTSIQSNQANVNASGAVVNQGSQVVNQGTSAPSVCNDGVIPCDPINICGTASCTEYIPVVCVKYYC